MQLLSVHPVLGCKSVSESLRFYARIGFQIMFVDDEATPRYAAVRRDNVVLHLQWADADQWREDMDRPAIRFTVADVDQLHAEFLAAIGNEKMSEGPWSKPASTPWGTREFHVRDPGGNSLQFYDSTEN